MGFFKKVGSGLKTFAKQNINFKSLVSLAGAIPIAGGVIDKVAGTIQANKDAKNQALAQKNAEAQFAIVQHENETVTALKDAGIQMANNVVKNGTTKLAETLLASAYDGTSQGSKSALAKVGADMADMTIMEWLKSHVKHIAIGLGAIGVFLLIRKNGTKKRKW